MNCAFNTDGDFFCAGNEKEYRILRVGPLELVNRSTKGVASLSFESNLMIMVPFQQSVLERTSVVVYDDKEQQALYQLDYSSPVVGVKVHNSNLAVLFSNKCFVYSLPQPKKRLEIETGWNDGPLVDMVDGHVLLIATVSKNKGQLQLTWLHDKPITQLIQAHHSNVRVLALSRNGQYVATASVKGTLVRIFETRTGKLLYEFRRGSDPATIYAIQFDLECTRIAVTSDKGTIHVFLLDPKEIENHRNPLITPLSPYLPKYFSSDWSMCAISLPTQAKAMVMLNKSDLFCICTDGCYFHYSYNIHGNYRLESFYNYLEL